MWSWNSVWSDEVTAPSSPPSRKRQQRRSKAGAAVAPSLPPFRVVQVDLTPEPPVAPDDKKIHERRPLPPVPAKRAGKSPKK